MHTPLLVPRTAAIGAYFHQIPRGLGPDLYVERCQWPSSRGKSGQKELIIIGDVGKGMHGLGKGGECSGWEMGSVYAHHRHNCLVLLAIRTATVAPPADFLRTISKMRGILSPAHHMSSKGRAQPEAVR